MIEVNDGLIAVVIICGTVVLILVVAMLAASMLSRQEEFDGVKDWRQMADALKQINGIRKDSSVARFGAGDYRSISAILGRFSSGYPSDSPMSAPYFERQETLEDLVDSLCEMYQADNRFFDENRFRMDALGYIERGPKGET